MDFHKIDNTKKHMQVANQIIGSIRTGIYKVGDKLPPERVIASKMGVGRPSVREALVALSMMGVLDIRQGNGIYVQKELGDLQYDLLRSAVEIEESPYEAFQIREFLENLTIQLMDLSDKRIMENLQKAVRKMSEAVEKDNYEQFLNENRAFHRLMVQATQNTLLEKIMDYLMDTTKKRLWNEMSKSYLNDHMENSFRIHREIFLALRNKDKPCATKYMREHFQLVKHFFNT